MEGEGKMLRAEAKFIRAVTVQVSRWPAPWQESHCSGPAHQHWVLGMSEEVVATERSLSICTADFLLPLPEGNVLHLSELNAY